MTTTEPLACITSSNHLNRLHPAWLAGLRSPCIRDLD